MSRIFMTVLLWLAGIAYGIAQEDREALKQQGFELYQEGKYAQALNVMEQVRISVEKEFGTQHPEYASVLNNLALLNTQLENYAKAENLYVEVVEIRAHVMGKNHPSYLHSINDLASLYSSLGKYEKAEPLYLESKEIVSQLYGQHHANYATVLINLALLYKHTGNYAKAEAQNLEALEIYRNTLGRQNGNYATALVNLAELYRITGYYSKAEQLYLEALEIDEQVSGKDHHSYATTLNNLALLYVTMGNFTKAESLYNEALKIDEKALGKQNSAYAAELNNLASLHEDMGRYDKAESLYQESGKIYKEVFGEDHPDYATTINNLASLYLETNHYPEAETFYRQFIEINRKLYGEDNPKYALSLNNLAYLYYSLGDYKKAEPLYLKSLEIDRKTLGKNNPAYALDLNNLAELYRSMDNYAKAEPLYREALEIRARVVGKTHVDYATSLNNIASLYYSQGQYHQAEPYFREAVELRGNVLGKRHPDYASAINNLALVYYSDGNYAKAESLMLEALDVRAKALGKKHPDYAQSLNNLAELYKAMKNFSRADQLYQESISIKLKELSTIFPALSEREKDRYYETNKLNFTNFEMYCAERVKENPDLINSLYNLRLSTKGLLFNESNKIRDNILDRQDPVLMETYEQWKSKRDYLAKVFAMSTTEKSIGGIDEEKLEDEVNALEKQLSQQADFFSAKGIHRSYTWQDLRAILKPGEIAIEVVRTLKKKNNQNVPVYAVMLVDANTFHHPQIVLIEHGDELEYKFIRFYRNAIQQKIKDTLSYTQFWKPIAEKSNGAQTIFFSADGVYNQINLNTLLHPGSGKFLIDEVMIQPVTSTRDLMTKKFTSIKSVNEAFLFGFPDYNNAIPAIVQAQPLTYTRTSTLIKDTTQRFFSGDDINELPGTKIEIETIEDMLIKKNVKTHQYQLEKATESALKQMNNPQVLHIATHGFFLADLTVDYPDERSFGGIKNSKLLENPLLRSGLLFAGARNAFQSDKKEITGEDGVLTAYEAMNLNLYRTDLVVLSACETGLGVTTNGEGVYGLQRAFRVAGAKSVLMSLWKVSDVATKELMTLFYQIWLDGKSPREAMRSAQLLLREKYPDPYYWGAFVMVGE